MALGMALAVGRASENALPDAVLRNLSCRTRAALRVGHALRQAACGVLGFARTERRSSRGRS
jgi:hypothetical protein